MPDVVDDVPQSHRAIPVADRGQNSLRAERNAANARLGIGPRAHQRFACDIPKTHSVVACAAAARGQQVTFGVERDTAYSTIQTWTIECVHQLPRANVPKPHTSVRTT